MLANGLWQWNNDNLVLVLGFVMIVYLARKRLILFSHFFFGKKLCLLCVTNSKYSVDVLRMTMNYTNMLHKHT